MPAVEVLVQSAALPVGQQAWPSHGSVRLSSGVPLQSLSNPSQLSAFGVTAFWHTLTPCTQARVPAMQVPTLVAPQLPPTSVGLSSTVKSQLLSTPSQISVGKAQLPGVLQSSLPVVAIVDGTGQW